MAKWHTFKLVDKLMGNRFELCILHHDPLLASQLLEGAKREILRIEYLLSTYKDNSQTNQINKMAGVGFVAVNTEVFELISRSIRISEITQGAFDLTYGGIDKRFWNFDKDMKSLPDKALAKKALGKVNFRKILLDKSNQRVMLLEKGMRIGFGGIGKGYAADMAKFFLKNNGVDNGYINASGDLNAWGLQSDGQKWTIGITDPDCQHELIGHMQISELAVATSGTYEKYAVIEGKRFAHTIDPRTGMPASGVKSATVICPIAELADAMCTPLMVLGPLKGLEIVAQINQMEALVIDEHDKIYKTKGIKLQE